MSKLQPWDGKSDAQKSRVQVGNPKQISLFVGMYFNDKLLVKQLVDTFGVNVTRVRRLDREV